MMSAVHAAGVQPHCRPSSSRDQHCSSFRPFCSGMRRGLTAPVAPLLRSRPANFAAAALGGAKDPEEEPKLTRETEPDEFWQTPSEAKGENPAKDPLAIIGVLGILFPFIILGIAIATGYVDLGTYRYGGH